MYMSAAYTGPSTHAWERRADARAGARSGAAHPRARGSDVPRRPEHHSPVRSIHARVGATRASGRRRAGPSGPSTRAWERRLSPMRRLADGCGPSTRAWERRGFDPNGDPGSGPSTRAWERPTMGLARKVSVRSIHACVGATLQKPWTFVALRPSKCPRTRSVGLVRTRTHVQSTRPRRIRKRDRATPCQPKRGRIRERAGEWPSSCVTDRTSTPWSHPRSAAAPNRALGLRPRVDSSAAVRRSTRFVRAMTDSGTSA